MFTPQTLEFLAEAPYRSREWLAQNRERYRNAVLYPQQQLITELTPFMQELDPALVGKPSRIYNDSRFVKNRPPLRGCAWVIFAYPGYEAQDHPAFFVELFPDHYRHGMGFFSASPAKMSRFRAAIDADPAAFAELAHSLPPGYAIMGDTYKQRRSGHLPPPVPDWYDRKTLWLQQERPVDGLLFSQALPNALRTAWAPCVPLFRFLARA